MDTQQVTSIPQTATTAAQEQAANYASDLHTLMFAGQALVDGCQAINAEMLAFWQSRLKHGMATGQRLLECGSPQGAMEIQLDYAKAALQAYLDQSTKVAGLLTHALTDSLMPKGRGARRADRPTPWQPEHRAGVVGGAPARYQAPIEDTPAGPALHPFGGAGVSAYQGAGRWAGALTLVPAAATNDLAAYAPSVLPRRLWRTRGLANPIGAPPRRVS